MRKSNNKKQYKVGSVFDGKKLSADSREVEIMREEIAALGGILHFTIETAKDGWVAQCDEIKGIITGGASSNPTDKEIELNIRDAVHCAFNIPRLVHSKDILENVGRTISLQLA